MIRIEWKKLLISIAVSLGVGMLAGLLTMGSMELYGAVEKPPLSPPAVLFPIVWTVLYILMGISAYLVGTAREPSSKKTRALAVYGAQLVLNFLWPLVFFNAQAYLAAFVILILLWALVLAMIILFFGVSKPSAYLQIPYFIWLTFAAYLNLSVYLLNQ